MAILSPPLQAPDPGALKFKIKVENIMDITSVKNINRCKKEYFLRSNAFLLYGHIDSTLDPEPLT